MKTYFSLLIALITVCSCSKLERAIESSNEDISGTYVLSSALWRGGTMDFDGQGTISQDLTVGLANYGNMNNLKADMGALVYEIPGKRNPESRIEIAVPLQDLTVNGEGKIEFHNIFYSWIDFPYSVGKDGSVSIGDAGYSKIEYDEYRNPQFKDICNARIISIKNGTIYAEITVSYYDFHTKGFLKSLLTLCYTKVRPVE